MKNLFKNLMLVAVAAMAFTACSQDNNEVNKLERKTVYNFQANIADDDTRSGFAEKEEGATAYKSEWFGDETIKVFVTNYSDYNAVTTASINAEGKFSFELTDAPENFFMTVCSPAESWESEYTAIIPTEQTPLANSVDPKAHLLNTAGAIYVQNGVADKINMTHQVAYGKMTVNGVDFEIDHVVIDLVGSFYGSARELSYTINADNVENNTFWFATQPIEVAEFTVTAVDAEGNAVAKTVDVAAAEKTLSFNYGRVGTFSVSGLEKVEEKYDSTYAYVYQNYDDTDKEIMFVAEDGRGLRIDFYNVYEDNCIVPGTYTFSGPGYMYPNWSYYYANVNGYYTSKLNSGQAVVSLEDGQYKIVFTNMACDETIYVDKFTFKGQIDDIDYPDPRTKLAAPNVTAQITGKTIILDWEPVTGADSYLIEIYSDVETVEPVSTTETHFEYTVKSYDSNYSFEVTAVVAEDNAEYRNSGYSSSVEYSDPREQLPAPTNVSATVDGLNITISWDEVENAVGYEINYYDNGNITKSTTKRSITLEMSTYNNEYYFYLSSVADENSDSYRSSDDAYITVTTEKDPNAVLTADYTATNIVWNNSEQRFEFICADLQHFHIKMNAEDRPNNNSFAVGEYTGVASRNVGVKQFSVSQKVNISVGWTDTSDASTMSIDVKDGEYVIYIAYVAKYSQGAFTLMYKGLPDGFVLPDGTGGGGETPEPELPTVKDLYNVTWNYELDSSSSGVYGHLWTVTSGDGGFYAKVGTDSRNNCTTSTSFTLGEYAYHTQFADGGLKSGMYFTMTNIEIEGVGYSNYDVDGKMVVTIENGAYAITIDLYKKADGSKITTLVGTFGSADSGSGDNTGDGDNTGGGGDTPTEDFSNWNYGAVINTSSGVVTLTDKTGNGRVVEFKLNEVAMTTFYGNTTRSNYFTDVKVDGVAATATPESWFKFARSGNVYFVEINMVINGVTYTGVAAELSF